MNKHKKGIKEKIDTLATLKKNCRVGENIYNEITDKRLMSRIQEGLQVTMTDISQIGDLNRHFTKEEK